LNEEKKNWRGKKDPAVKVYRKNKSDRNDVLLKNSLCLLEKKYQYYDRKKNDRWSIKRWEEECKNGVWPDASVEKEQDASVEKEQDANMLPVEDLYGFCQKGRWSETSFSSDSYKFDDECKRRGEEDTEKCKSWRKRCSEAYILVSSCGTGWAFEATRKKCKSLFKFNNIECSICKQAQDRREKQKPKEEQTEDYKKKKNELNNNFLKISLCILEKKEEYLKTKGRSGVMKASRNWENECKVELRPKPEPTSEDSDDDLERPDGGAEEPDGGEREVTPPTTKPGKKSGCCK